MTILPIFPLLLGLALGGELPTIESASAAVGEERLVVEVRTTEPITREDLRTKLQSKSLLFYLDGTRVSRGKRVLGDAELPVNVYPRLSYTKLEVPWPADWTCAGPVTTTVFENGARATVGCQRQGATTANGAAAGASATIAAPASKTEPKAEQKPTRPTGQEAPAASPPAETTIAPAERPAAAPEASADKAAAAPAATARSAPQKAKTKTAMASDDRKGPRTTPTPPWVMLSGLGLVGLAGYFVWRRRRQQQSSLIRILETASLGPRRALIVAEINGERVILGSSEAGISVISPPAEGETPHRTPGPMALRPVEVPVAPTAGLPEESEGGLLARLFKRRRESDLIEGDEPPSTMAEDFRDLLQDSLEDEELRQRLAAGMGGRTS